VRPTLPLMVKTTLVTVTNSKTNSVGKMMKRMIVLFMTKDPAWKMVRLKSKA